MANDARVAKVGQVEATRYRREVGVKLGFRPLMWIGEPEAQDMVNALAQIGVVAQEDPSPET